MENQNVNTSNSWDDRTRMLLGEQSYERLIRARILVVGVGGVGGYAAEMLARSGIGHLTLIDADDVDVTNLNRQLIALNCTIGKSKVRLYKERFEKINPMIDVEAKMIFITPENIDSILDAGYDYVIDAIDTVAPKVALIAGCMHRGIKIISSMGAGGRTDPTKVGYFDLWGTTEDGLARAVRQRLKKMGLRRSLKVVASREAPDRKSIIDIDTSNKRTSYGTLATIPSLFGILLASKVINEIL